MFQRKQWVPQRDALAEEFRVIALDLPGHGAHDESDFRLAQAVDLLGDVFESEVDDSAVLVGHSLGGYVVTVYAQRNPDDLDGLVVSGSSANPVGSLETATRAVSALWRLLTRSDRIEAKIRSSLEKWVHKRDLSRETKAEIIDAGFFPRQFGVAGPELAGKDFRSSFASYPGPALVLNGEADAIMRRGEDKHVAAAANASVEVIDDTGHICNLEDEAAFTAAIKRFSRRVLSDQGLGVEGR
jgi:pimeloyl-ACP methyl ester carboxylesterase